MYVIDNTASANGTSLRGEIVASYAVLASLFGAPAEADGYKVSGEWTFRDTETGAVITLYDWKMTNLYDDNTLTVEEFRALPEYEWHVGAKDSAIADAFIERLSAVLKAYELPHVKNTEFRLLTEI